MLMKKLVVAAASTFTGTGLAQDVEMAERSY
jgi:hypothetical protein